MVYNLKRLFISILNNFLKGKEKVLKNRVKIIRFVVPWRGGHKIQFWYLAVNSKTTVRRIQNCFQISAAHLYRLNRKLKQIAKLKKNDRNISVFKSFYVKRLSKVIYLFNIYRCKSYSTVLQILRAENNKHKYRIQ